MSVFSKQFDSIVAADLQALVDNSVSETKTLEYKESLPGNSDGDKKEFLADVSSFANASGGYIIFGMKENIRHEREYKEKHLTFVVSPSLTQTAKYCALKR